jgi:hypothetical protein
MTPRRPRTARHAAIDAPSPSGTLDRLHNSGWGRPPEQYRTPVLGHAVLLDLPLLLGAWEGPPPDEREALRKAICAARNPYGPRPVPLALLGLLAARVRLALDAAHAHALRAAGVPASPTAELPVRPDALVELARLRDRVHALGWTAGVVLMAAPQPQAADLAPTDWHHPTDADEVALALVAAALLHGPMVLWGAEPALERLREMRRLPLRWLRPAQAADDARHRWQALLGMETRP